MVLAIYLHNVSCIIAFFMAPYQYRPKYMEKDVRLRHATRLMTFNAITSDYAIGLSAFTSAIAKSVANVTHEEIFEVDTWTL